MKKEHALPSIKFDYFDVKEEVIDGVKVFSKELPWVSGVFSFNIQFQAGAYHDPIGKEGLAHIYEHMCLKGVPSAPTKEDMQIVKHEVFMNTLNAYTNYNQMCITGQVLAGKIEDAQKILSEIVSRPILDDEVFQNEKKAIEQEFWRYFSNQKTYELKKLINDDLWRGNYYTRFLNALGSIETFRACTREDLLWYINTFLNKSNVTVYIAGDVSDPGVKKFVENIITSLPIGEKSKEIPLQTKEWLPEVSERRISDKDYFGAKEGAEVKQTSIFAGRIIPSNVDLNLLTLSIRFLTQIMNRELRVKRNLVYTTGVGSVRARYGIQINMSASVDPKKESETSDALKGCLEMAIGDAENDMFERVKRSLLEEIITSESLSEGVVRGMAIQNIDWNEITKNKDDIESTMKLTFEDIQAFIKKWFDLKGLYWYIFTP